MFGNLTVRTANAPSGSVSWWYHVAPIVQVNGQKYVLDPAIEPHGPLKLEDWLARMDTNINRLEVAVCSSGSYSPVDSCDHVSDGVEPVAMGDQQEFLSLEWTRQIELGRNPLDVLGPNPPWH